MNGINRIGQRIVCVKVGMEVVCRGCGRIPHPELGGTYTVAGFADFDTRPIADGMRNVRAVNIPGVSLKEIPDIGSCQCEVPGHRELPSPLPWLLMMFRPVDERETDISVFTDLVAPAPKVPEPA